MSRVYRRILPLASAGLTLVHPALIGCGTPQTAATPRLAVAETRTITVSATAAGVIEPVTMVEVKSKASGEIVEVLVEEGDEVRRGQLLVRVDPRIPENAVVQARADSVVARARLDNAEAQFNRAETLHQTQAITDLEFEGARLDRATAYAELVTAQRTLEDAKIAFEDTEVRAPTTGVILGRAVEVGSVIASASRDVSGGAVLLRMASLDTVQVRAMVDETDVGMIQAGVPVTITVAAYPNRPFTGEVLRLGGEAVVQQSVTMFPVLIRIHNQRGLLRPGMNAEVEIHIGSARDVLAVPSTALRPRDEMDEVAEELGLSRETFEQQLAQAPPLPPTRDSGTYAALSGPPEDREDSTRTQRLFGGEFVVLVSRQGRPHATPVRTGLTDFAYTAVLSGLSEGDSVYILPTAGLLEDQRERDERIRDQVRGPLGQ